MATAKTKARLGRGLSGLISGGNSARKGTAAKSGGNGAAKPAKVPTVDGADGALPFLPGYAEIAVTGIEPNPFQPRKEFDEEELRELAESIRAEGLLQPIVVRKAGDGKYQLIAGERRWRACKTLRLKTIPARIIEAGDASSASISLIENLQRAGLNPIEEALGYASLLRDFDLTQEAVAERVGKGRATVANALRLLQLSSEVQGYLGKGIISTGHAKVLLSVEGEARQGLLARKVVEDGLSVRALEKVVKSGRLPGAAQPFTRPEKGRPPLEDSAVRDIEKQLCTRLNTRVAMKHTAKKGRIVIEYYGNDDLQRILEKIGVSG